MIKNIIKTFTFITFAISAFATLTGCGKKENVYTKKREIKYNKFVESGGLKKDSDLKDRKRVTKELGIE